MNSLPDCRTSGISLAVCGLILLCGASASADEATEEHTAPASELIIRNHLRVLGLPQGQVDMREHAARVRLTVDGQPAVVEFDRYSGTFSIVQASPETRLAIEHRIRVPGVRELRGDHVPVPFNGPAGGGTGALGSGGQCESYVQGKIAWNTAGNKSWPRQQIDGLCSGAENSNEPGLCFKRLMQGEVSWGASTKWAPDNALRLCSGSTDANSTVGCFEREIGNGGDWKAAIDTCNPRSGSSH